LSYAPVLIFAKSILTCSSQGVNKISLKFFKDGTIDLSLVGCYHFRLFYLSDLIIEIYCLPEVLMAEIQELNRDTFQDEVINSEQPVLVDFSAVWCGPCKMLDPVVKQLAKEWDGKVKFGKLDVDHNPELAMEYQVMGVPTLMLFKNGEPVERVTGYQPKDRLEKKFKVHFS